MMDFKGNKRLFLLFSNIPVFQYSIIPWKWHKTGAIKRSLISINYRISETLNQILFFDTSRRRNGELFF